MKRQENQFPKSIYKCLSQDVLISKARTGDDFALDELIKRNEKYVYLMLYHLDARNANIKDMAQDVLLRLARSIHSLKDSRKFKSWLNQIITNIFFDDLRRKQKKMNTVSIDSFFADDNEQENKIQKELECPKTHPDEVSESSELDLIIRDAICELEEPYRVAIVLRELQGLSYEEIASTTKTSIGTVKSRLARARQKLQYKIKPYLEQ